ncbi:GNAT family N-acetyltransferase [Bizionia arctica]|uniref:Ribosomal-protein-amino-adic N-acetyltransferase n=1 Tax=Bizionia arctica TaxID=1495645 RepID=A0A917LJY9_9FLAO|nr:GNAT family N-acetyltransferase [Bizionia arctica]GGG35910.1 ribosomal-protein-amino-adic N-acetyltransferase [Bizionia arctica]
MTFSTETFKLEALKPEDAPSLNALMISNGKNFQQFLPKTLAQNLSKIDSEIYISKQNKAIKERTEFTYAIKDIETNVVAGLVLLKSIDYNLKQGEFAYCIGKKFSGKGWITQSINSFTKFAFEELGLENLQIIIHEANTSSVNVAKRCGFTWTKTLKDEFINSDDIALDMELYELQYERQIVNLQGL